MGSSKGWIESWQLHHPRNQRDFLVWLSVTRSFLGARHGAWDGKYRKVKWGPFFSELTRTLTVTVQRPNVRSTVKLRRRLRVERLDGFSGTVSFDGVNRAISIR